MGKLANSYTDCVSVMELPQEKGRPGGPRYRPARLRARAGRDGKMRWRLIRWLGKPDWKQSRVLFDAWSLSRQLQLRWLYVSYVGEAVDIPEQDMRRRNLLSWVPKAEDNTLGYD